MHFQSFLEFFHNFSSFNYSIIKKYYYYITTKLKRIQVISLSYFLVYTTNCFFFIFVKKINNIIPGINIYIEHNKLFAMRNVIIKLNTQY